MRLAQVKDLLRLSRFPNLVVVALTEALLYLRVIRPALAAEDLTTRYTVWKLALVMIVTLLITLGGYLINDLSDGLTDGINRPGRNPVERLGRDVVTWLYAATVSAGFLISLLLVFRLGERHLLWIYPVATSLLALYSVWLKRLPAAGNLLVAGYCAAVVAIPLVAVREQLLELSRINPNLAYRTLRTCLLFATFAFLATLLRELVKDLEDVRGDRAAHRRTLPIALGEVPTRRLGYLLGAATVLALLLPPLLAWPAFQTPPALVVLAFLLVLLNFLLYRLARARAPREYRHVSQLLKLFMLTGLGLLVCYQ